MELEIILKNIFSQFNVASSFKGFQIFSSGHINDTYLIITDTKPYFVMQKINSFVFKEAAAVIDNKFKITNYLKDKKQTTLQYITTKNNKNYLIDEDGNFWNLCLFIENSETFLHVNSTKIALEAGKATGSFLVSVNDFSEQLNEVLPNFHNMTFRFSQFNKALIKASPERKKQAKEWIDFVLNNKEEMCALDYAIADNKIPLRVTHNDTKISNILFDENQNAICLIDLDTVMLGAVHFDYGDAVRTICNTVNEDETDISKIKFDFDYFKSYTQGFIETIKNSLNKNEVDFLPISPQIITFIIGLRFLTDFLNNDVYYQTKYDNHNLDRAKNQLTLVKEIKKCQNKITQFIKEQI